ncbi:MAG: tetratricopeptide repeat protein, partial [Dehalococcoidia bacterium]
MAEEGTVLGDFANTSFTHFGVTSKFYRRAGKFFVQTEGPDGKLHDYEIKYTFGVDPLQQYLIEFPGGRYQVLGIGWDSRRRDEGGQRWFHLYPNEKIPHGDELHWTGPNQNWNHMCAECHSTNLRKNYDLEQDRYKTDWSEINVSCEACHGPGSTHIAWAESGTNGQKGEGARQKGLVVKFEASEKATWIPNLETGTATRSKPRASNIQLNTCARCHSRRRVIHEEYLHGQPLLETHAPALLDEGLYHQDGQIEGEVYVYGSFLQSKMYRAGVTCSDCHDPHSLKTRAVGNKLCAQCHASAKFDAPEHHFHKPTSRGAQCVECHMPATTYMVVDPRRDHSFRIPRPDLSVTIGTPNACTQCHQKKSAQWAENWVAKWHGTERDAKRHYGEVLKAGREGLPGTERALAKLGGDSTEPGIVRATALALLRHYPSQTTVNAIAQGVKEEDPLVRIGALRALDVLRPASRHELAHHLLSDPIRTVRIEAARALAPVSSKVLRPPQQAALNEAMAEYIEAQLVNAERPSAHLNLGILYAERSQFERAEAAYRMALRLAPSFYPALVNLADLYRLQKRDKEGEAVLRQALTLVPDDANVHHSLGLLLVRVGRQQEAIEALKRAAKLQPNDPRHGYVYGVALNSIGMAEKAITVLEET